MRLAAQSFVILGLMASPALAQMWPNNPAARRRIALKRTNDGA